MENRKWKNEKWQNLKVGKTRKLSSGQGASWMVCLCTTRTRPSTLAVSECPCNGKVFLPIEDLGEDDNDDKLRFNFSAMWNLKGKKLLIGNFRSTGTTLHQELSRTVAWPTPTPTQPQHSWLRSMYFVMATWPKEEHQPHNWYWYWEIGIGRGVQIQFGKKVFLLKPTTNGWHEKRMKKGW